MQSSAQDPVPAFSPEIRSDFYEWIRHPYHTNRARMSIEKQQILQRFLRTPGLKPVSKLERDLRSQVHSPKWLSEVVGYACYLE